jgi:hypothetical protein
LDEQIAIERILEIDSLTDELGDDEANYLLEWASAHAPALIKGLADDDVAGEKVNALIAVLRQVNTMAALRKTRSADEIRGEVEQFATLVEGAFGAKPMIGPSAGIESKLADAAPVAADAVALDLIHKPDLEFVKAMLAIADTAATKAPEPPPDPAPDENPSGAAPASANDESEPSITF